MVIGVIMGMVGMVMSRRAVRVMVMVMVMAVVVVVMMIARRMSMTDRLLMMRVKLMLLATSHRSAEPLEKQACADSHHNNARDQAQQRVQLLRQYILRCKQRNQPQREHARSMGNGYRKTEERRVPSCAARPDEVSSHDGLPMAGRHRMQASEPCRKEQAEQHDSGSNLRYRDQFGEPIARACTFPPVTSHQRPGS